MKIILSIIKNSILKLFLSILVLLIQQASYAQFQVDFTSNLKEGCVPLVVDFQNISNIDTSLVTVNWNFGNGNQSVEKSRTQAAYNVAGVYNIVLTVDSSGVKKTKSFQLSVYDNPTVNFESKVKSGCVPLEVQFEDLTVSKQNKIVQWTWNFGDGTGSNVQHPKNTFTSEDVFNITLVAIDEKGCKSTLVKDNFITTTHQPVIDFNYSDTVSCSLPLRVNFTEKINSLYPYQIHWDFGNGASSNSSKPSINFTSEGTYPVKLTTTNNFGCKNEIQKNITIKKEDFKVDVVTNGLSGCAPYKLKFSTQSNFNITNYQWNIGSYTSQKSNDSLVLDQAGTYELILIAKDDKGCSVTTRNTIVVHEKPNVDFTLDKNLVCKGPVNVQFTGITTSDVIKHHWAFSYTDPSTEANPLVTFIRDGVYNVIYTGTNQYGCSDTIRKNGIFEIKKPLVGIVATVDKGCVPFQTELSVIKTGDGDIKNIQWIYPDMTTFTGNQLPAINVSNEGINTYTAIVEFEGNCPTQTVTKSITGGSLGSFQANITPLQVCIKKGVVGELTSTDADVKYTWHMGDGTKIEGIKIAHEYEDVGEFQVSVVAEKSGCKDSIPLDKIKVLLPKSSFTVTKLCSAGEYRFVNRSIGNDINTWNFDDGNIQLDLANSFTYTFTEKKVYKVKLVVENASTGCKDSLIVDIDNSSFNTGISFEPQKGCVPYVANFELNNTAYNRFEWKIGGNTYTTRAISFPVTEVGIFDLSLTATRRDGCKEEYFFKDIVTVTELIADFEIDPIGGCAPINVTVTENSQSQYSNVIEWNWNLGGISSSNEKVASETFQFNKDEDIVLIVKDNFGCKDTISKVVPIFIPTADFKVDFNSVCTGVEFELQNISKGVALKYLWKIGDHYIESSDEHPKIVFEDEGVYDVSLLVIDANQCEDFIEKKNFIKVENFEYNFDGYPKFKTCPELQTKFEIIPSNINYKYINWDFGNGNQSSDVITNPVNIYAESGIFDVSVVLEDYRGCKDTIVKEDFIEVKGPRGQVTFTPSDGCLPLTVKFQASFIDSKYNFWDFGNGVGYLDNELLEEMTYVYNDPGKVIPSLILDDGLGCVTQLHYDTIFVYGAKVKIETSDMSVCTGGLVEFKDVTLENEHVPVINRLWEFSNGQISNDIITQQYLNVDSTSYIQAKLTVETGVGCIDTDSVLVKVHEYPTIEIEDEYIICKGDSIQLQPTGAKYFEWEPLRYFKDPNHSQPKVSPISDTWFDFTAYDTILCPSHGSLLVRVTEEFDAEVGPDTVICMGEEVKMYSILSDIHSNPFEYRWYANGNLISELPDPVMNPTEDVAYILNIKNGSCKELNIPVFVGVSEKPDVIAYTDTLIAKGQSITLHAKSDQNVIYNWSPNIAINCMDCMNPVVAPIENTEYKVVVTNDYGCNNEASVYIEVKDYCSSSYIKTPNIFSPNGDGINDEFRISADRDKVNFKSLKIYNRYGEKIFSTIEDGKAWDGNYNNVPVNTGVYVYYYEYECYTGSTNILNGNVTLTR